MKPIVITIGADGNAQCLHTEALPLESLGTLNITRASTIEFSDARQLWEVRFPGSDFPVYASKSRLACLDWEHDEVNRRLLGKGAA